MHTFIKHSLTWGDIEEEREGGKIVTSQRIMGFFCDIEPPGNV